MLLHLILYLIILFPFLSFLFILFLFILFILISYLFIEIMVTGSNSQDFADTLVTVMIHEPNAWARHSKFFACMIIRIQNSLLVLSQVACLGPSGHFVLRVSSQRHSDAKKKNKVMSPYIMLFCTKYCNFRYIYIPQGCNIVNYS